MSVHYIYYQNGAKFMRPILSAEEYLQIRDGGRQKELLHRIREQGDTESKKHLVQFNYSCMPSATTDNGLRTTDGHTALDGHAAMVCPAGCGPLKGSTTPSNSVGMDVDFNPSDPNYAALMADVPERVISHKEELGLLMLERSATKGYHLAFRRRPELSQEENLRWASTLLGVEYDAGAKDITRVFFTTSADPEDLIFLSEELFGMTTDNSLQTTDATSQERSLANAQDDKRGIARNDNTADKKGEAPSVDCCPLSVVNPTAVSLIAFDLCVKEAGLQENSLDTEGVHNWHTNLMAVLSVGLPKLMSREQLEAVVKVKLPNYSQTEDCRKVIAYFYEKYQADQGFMSVTLRNINARAQQLAGEEQPEDDDEKDMNMLAEGWTPPPLPKKLPRLLELLTANYDPRFKEILLLSALPALSAHASHFRATYLSGKITPPQQFVALIGNSGSGKNNATDLFNAMIHNTLKRHDDKEWEKVRENAELRDKKANAKDRPPKYEPKLRVFETTSKSSILSLQNNLGPFGLLLGIFSEVDGLAGSARALYSDISVLLRKGWDGDMHRQFYMSESTCNTYAEMNIALLMEGTVKAMLERMFNDNNCESGLMQRCIPVIMPKHKRTFRPPRMNYLNEDERIERDALLMQLYQSDLALGDEVKLLDLPLMNKAIGEWFDSLEVRYNDGQLTEAEADLSHRCGEFMLRAAIPLVALYGQETKEIVDFCRWVGETAHYNLCHIFGPRVQRDLLSSEKLLADTSDARRTVVPLLNKMADVFTVKELQEQRRKDGQSDDVRMLLSRYCKNGKLIRIGRGVFRKAECNIVTVTKMRDPNVTN